MDLFSLFNIYAVNGGGFVMTMLWLGKKWYLHYKPDGSHTMATLPPGDPAAASLPEEK